MRRILASALLLPGLALADQVTLKDGKVIEGLVLSEDGKPLVLRTADGSLKTPAADSVASTKRDAPLPPLPAADPDQGPLEDAVIRVGPGGISRKEYAWWEKGQGKCALLWLLETEPLFQQALKEGLHKNDYVRDRVIEAFQSSQSTERIDPRTFTEEDLQAFWKAHPDLFTPPPSLKLRLLQFPLLTDPKEIQQTLKKARAKPDSVQGWKELDWMTQDEVHGICGERIMEAALKMKAGQISEAVSFGGLLNAVQVVDRKQEAAPPFDEVREKVRFELVGAKQEAMKKTLPKDPAVLYQAALKAGCLREATLRNYLIGCLVSKRKKSKEDLQKELRDAFPVRVNLGK